LVNGHHVKIFIYWHSVVMS